MSVILYFLILLASAEDVWKHYGGVPQGYILYELRGGGKQDNLNTAEATQSSKLTVNGKKQKLYRVSGQSEESREIFFFEVPFAKAKFLSTHVKAPDIWQLRGTFPKKLPVSMNGKALKPSGGELILPIPLEVGQKRFSIKVGRGKSLRTFSIPYEIKKRVHNPNEIILSIGLDSSYGDKLGERLQFSSDVRTLIGKSNPNATLKLLGKSVKADEQGDFVFELDNNCDWVNKLGNGEVTLKVIPKSKKPAEFKLLIFSRECVKYNS